MIKVKKDDIVQEVHPNTLNVWIRAGFEVIGEFNEEAEKAELSQKLEEAGVEVDGRWGLKRLQEEIEKL